MKELSFGTKNREMLLQVLRGELKQFEIGLIPTNEEKLIMMEEPDEDGDVYPMEDENGNCVPIKYDALRLYMEKDPDGEFLLISVKNSYTAICSDEDGNPLILEEISKEIGEPYLEEIVVYELGEIIETNMVH